MKVFKRKKKVKDGEEEDRRYIKNSKKPRVQPGGLKAAVVQANKTIFTWM